MLLRDKFREYLQVLHGMFVGHVGHELSERAGGVRVLRVFGVLAVLGVLALAPKRVAISSMQKR
jgi:hypothetical protein